MRSPAIREWCDLHHDFVEEGRTRPLSAGSRYRICDACAEESRVAAIHPHLQTLIATLEHGATIDERAAAYGVLHQLQLYINRRLRPVRDELVIYITQQRMRRLGPLSLKSTGVGVSWPANEPGNWSDAMVQGLLRGYADDPATADFIRHVPEHLEVDTAALGAEVHAGNPAAQAMHRDLSAARLRTEEARSISLEVQPLMLERGT